jgi:hypothetical protein
MEAAPMPKILRLDVTRFSLAIMKLKIEAGRVDYSAPPAA